MRITYVEKKTYSDIHSQPLFQISLTVIAGKSGKDMYRWKNGKMWKFITFYLFSWIFTIHSLPISEIEAPKLAITNNSLEAIGIATKINQFFEDYGDQKSNVQEVKIVPDSHQPKSKSRIRLNLNLNVDIENGVPQKMHLPQGDLILMFVPNTQKVKQKNVRDFMKATQGPTSMSRISGGILFTSWLNQNPGNNGDIMGRSDSLPALLGNDQDLKESKPDKIVDQLHQELLEDKEIRKKWDIGAVPKFPFYHGAEISNSVPSIPEEKPKNPEEKKRPFMHYLKKPVSSRAKPDLDQLEKITEDLRKNYRNEDPDPVLAEKTEQLSRLIAELRKNYRQDDDVGLDLRPHINRNSVTAGELTRPIGQMTSAVQCSEINGETVCTRKTSSCQNSFGIGCTDGEKSTQNRLVPFSQPISNMNMRTTTTTRRPFIRRTTTTPAPTTTSLATTQAPQRQLQEAMAHHVMQMDAHDIADAFHDPMMMAIGSMVVMAGAYMAIVMQEQAAASAFALAAASGKK